MTNEKPIIATDASLAANHAAPDAAAFKTAAQQSETAKMTAGPAVKPAAPGAKKI